jgi:hypothetical protein
MPYERELKFEQKVLYPADTVNVMLGDTSVRLQGDQFTVGQAQDVSGTPFQNYTRPGLNAGETLKFDLSGQSANTGAAAAAPGAISLGDPTSLAVGLGALALVMLGIGLWWWQRGPRPGKPAAAGRESREDLLQALAELDDDYADGKVAKVEYERERAWLKQELRKVWTVDDSQRNA